MVWQDYIPAELSDLYDVYDYKHAATIIAEEFPEQFEELCKALLAFRFTRQDCIRAGGNESHIPKLFSAILRPMGWMEKRLEAQLNVYEIKRRAEPVLTSQIAHGSHKVDYLKGRVAFDLEWNSKDQTFDRDLYAFRAFYEYNAISAGVLVTRSLALNPIFRELDIARKYGASTTHIGKLLPRLAAGRHGGCPILVFGITPKLLKEE